MRKIRLGIIGCGTIADWHARAILASKDGVLAGVADVLYKESAFCCNKFPHAVYIIGSYLAVGNGKIG